MATFSSALRGAIVAAPGKQLYVADYAQIEARVLLWLAGDTEALGMFERGEDIYAEMARAIDARNPQRALGKVAILGLGYGMGAKKFRETAGAWGIAIDEGLAQRTVDAYRAKFAKVKQLWYGTERGARAAILYGSSMGWHVEGRFLYATLPSGRRLAYPDPAIVHRPTPWKAIVPTVSFMGMNTYTRKWGRQHAYGGLLVENITQAVARDLMAAALLRCEASGVYLPILSVHDEIIAEADAQGTSVYDFDQLVAQVPAWAAGLPVGVEAWTGRRYRK
jgi:DNA polymerase